MKYSIATVVLGLVSASWAASGAVTAIGEVATNLNQSLPQYEAAISQAAAQAEGAVSAVVIVQIDAILNANLAAIAEAVANGEVTVLSTTVNAAGGLQGAVTGLVQSDLDTLAAALELIANAITGLRATFSLIVTLRGDVQAAVQAEFLAVRALINPFINPIEAYAQAVVQSTAVASLSITGVQQAAADLQAAFVSLENL